MKTYKHWQTPGWRGDVTALIAGVLLPLSMAPYGKWPLGILSATVLAALLKGLNGKKGFIRSLFFGLGMYAAGVSWVFVSIHDFGNAGVPLALAMTGAFVAFLALVFAIPFYFYSRFLSRSVIGFVLAFPSVWILGEWMRSWLLTGFPWLYLGYAHVDTWLGGWAPLLGVFGIGWLGIVSGNIIAHNLCKIEAAPLSKQNLQAFVTPKSPLEMKWQQIYQPYIMDTLRTLSETAWDSDLVVWPEAAVPMLYTDAEEFLSEVDELAKKTNSALVTGLLYDDQPNQKYYNAIMGLGDAESIYFKQRLVPFGEYVPLEEQLRGLIDFFDLPNSIIHPGPKDQDNIKAEGYTIAPYICYEIVYPDLVARNLKNANIIITISNDAWFGDSIGPLQHYQMAQMRALENRRYVIRATNTGLSGVISPMGKTIKQEKQFEQLAFHAETKLVQGTTPFSRFGSKPIVALCFLVVALGLYLQRSPKYASQCQNLKTSS